MLPRRRWVGEWYHPVAGQGTPTAEQISKASGNCFIVGAIYVGFTVLAILCVFYQKSRAKNKRA